MTLEQFVAMGFDDLMAITLRCSRCTAKISTAPTEPFAIPETCPNGHQWKRYEDGGKHNAIQKLLDALRVAIASQDAGFVVRLDFKRDGDTSASGASPSSQSEPSGPGPAAA